MACSSCGTPKQPKVTLNSSYEPKVNNQVKMTDVLMSFTIEKQKNDTSGTDKKSD